MHAEVLHSRQSERNQLSDTHDDERKEECGTRGMRKPERQITAERRRERAGGGMRKFTHTICASKAWLCWL